MLKLLERIRRRNRERLARRHARAGLLESIAANETAILESLVFLKEEVTVDPAVAGRARQAVERMINLNH